MGGGCQAQHTPQAERERLELELELCLSSKEPKPVPRELGEVAKLKLAGVIPSYSDYVELPALLRDDLISWGIAEQRANQTHGNNSSR